LRMSNLHKVIQPLGRRRPGPGGRWIGVAAALFALAVVALMVWAIGKSRKASPDPDRGAEKSPVAGPATNGTISPAPPVQVSAPPDAPMEINRAVMVTVELDFGARVPSIAEALQAIERRHEPDDRQGRVFAVLDAYGEPTPDGKKLHLSMHVSTEKPGRGSLVFRKTGEVLWQSRVIQGTNAAAFSGKALTILVDDGTGRAFMVDGSGSPASLLEAHLRDTGQMVRDFWPENADREVTFIYSACGCPVKVMVRRVGDRTMRTRELPVMFPDDPSVMTVITRLMGW
jgi:hypothetical protein